MIVRVRDLRYYPGERLALHADQDEPIDYVQVGASRLELYVQVHLETCDAIPSPFLTGSIREVEHAIAQGIRMALNGEIPKKSLGDVDDGAARPDPAVEDRFKRMKRWLSRRK
jgi:hypothetical protein